MKNYIKNKTALITGATSGIGERLAKDLSQYGVHLILVGRDRKKLESVKRTISKKSAVDISYVVLDVREQKNVSKKLDPVNADILINNAGLALGTEPIDSGDTKKWDVMIDTNLKGLLYVSRAMLVKMKKLPTAHIVNIGSVAGKSTYPGGNVYCATKAAVHSLGESMNADLMGSNVKVSTIAPGAVNTNFSKTRFAGDSDKADSVYSGFKPLSDKNISSAVIYVLNTPKHVNIQYMDIMPTAQRNPYLLHRESK